jgi:Concanavalin A-like lectin/glucanases superfamily
MPTNKQGHRLSRWRERCLAAIATALLVPALAAVSATESGPAAAAASAADGDPSLLDEAAATALAAQTGEPVEVTARASDHQRVLANGDGTLTAEITAGISRVQRGGGWVDASSRLVKRADGSIGPAAASSMISFSPGGAAHPLARIEEGGQWLELDWPGALSVPVISGAKATYANVLPDVDLITESGVDGFSTFVVIKSAAAAADSRLARIGFSWAASRGLSLSEEGGGLVAKDSAGQRVFGGPVPRMWDSTGARTQDVPATAALGELEGDVGNALGDVTDEPEGALSAPIDLSVTGATVTLTPDPHLLGDPGVTFPLVIDPTVSSSWGDSETYWTMVWSDGLEFANNPTEHARVGYDGWSSATKKSRVFYRFDTDAFRGSGTEVSSAVFAHRNIHSPQHDCSNNSYGPSVELWRTGATSSSTTWSNQPSWVSKQSSRDWAHGHEDYCPGYDRVEWTGTSAARDAVDHNWSTLTLGLRSADESDRDGWRKYDNISGSYPVLTVTFNRPPNTPASAQINGNAGCGSTRFVNTSKPTFSAVVSDPDGGNLETDFEVSTTLGSAGTRELDTDTSLAATSSGNRATYTSTTALPDGPHHWRVRAGDSGGLWSDYGPNPSCGFTIDTAPPAAPVVSPLSASFTVGVAGQVEVDSPSTDVTEYWWGVNSDVADRGPVAVSNGAAATISFTPTKFGPSWIVAVAKDRAGNASPMSSPSPPCSIQPCTGRVDFRVGGTSAPNGQWRLDGNGNATVGGKDLTFAGGFSWVDGRWGVDDFGNPLDPTDKAVSVNGSTGAGATTAPGPVDSTQPFTVAAWVKLTAAVPPTSNAFALCEEGTYRCAFYLGVNGSLGAWAAAGLWDDTNTASPAPAFALGPPAQVGTWTHLVSAYDASARSLKLYVNGVPVATTTLPHQPFKANGPFVVGSGQYQGNPYSLFPGVIDEIRVYPGLLDDSQISTLYFEHRP